MAQDEPVRASTDPKHDTGDDGRGVGSEDQLVALMNRYESPLYAYLLSVVRDRDVALDCAQDTFLRAFHALSKGKIITGSWLYTVAHNRAVDEFRRQRRVQLDDGCLEEVPASETSTESALDVQTIMDRLSPLDREVLYLFEIAGFTTDEIGAMLGKRGSAVRQRLSRARQRFRALYSSELTAFEPTAHHAHRQHDAERKTGT